MHLLAFLISYALTPGILIQWVVSYVVKGDTVN